MMAGNPWRRLREILPQESTQVGTVQTDNGDGTTNVLLVGGGMVTATGTGYAPGSRVFVKGGQITGAAPALPVVNIEV